MLKKLSLIALFCATVSASAQYTVETHAGDPLVDGQTVEIGSIEAPANTLSFYVNNTGSENINMKIEFVSAENADGSRMEICFGLCYTGTQVGQSYPINNTVEIEPGMTQVSNGDHFKNTSDGGGNPVTYVFRFYQVDDAGVEIGEDLTLTYRYNPDLGVLDITTVKAEIISTNITDELRINATEDVTLTFYNVLGKAVKIEKVAVGNQRINTSDLASQMYIVQIQNAQGAVNTVKVMKR